MHANTASVSKARVAAALLTASSLMAGSFSASAQQMNLGAAPDYSACKAMQDPVASAKCIDDTMNASIANSKARIKAADEKLAAANKTIAATDKTIAANEKAIAASEKTIAANIATTAAARKEEICGDKLLVLAQDPKKKEAGQKILVAARKSPGDYGMCRLLSELTQ